MRQLTRIDSIASTLAAGCAALLLSGSPATAQVSGGTDRNVSKLANYQNECAIIKNPTNKLQLFASCNNSGPGLFAARSTDGGVSWIYPDAADKTIADGDAGQGPSACCDPTLAWDTFGNLFITYIDAGLSNIVTILSTDGGATFTNLASFGPASVDQPTIVAANTSAAGAPVAVWIVWNQSGQMRARGAAVTGLGTANVGAFGALQTIPGTTNCSFGDIAIAPTGVVVQACETLVGSGDGPETIRVNTDADGLGPGNFGAFVAATATNVGGFDVIPAQNSRTVDAEAGLAYDAFSTSPHFGRLYMVYTDEVVDESNNTDIMVRFSDDNGATWSAAIRVNDDPAAPVRSQFLPRIATNILSGNVGVCWHDARNSATNNTMQEFCTIATPAGAAPAFMANAQVGDGVSTPNGSNPPAAGLADIQYGDYSGMTYFQGLVHPIWADDSNSTGDNPDTTTRYDIYTDRVSGGAAAMEGDPHLTTVDGVHYDFQGAGEYVALRDAGGLEIQARMTPVPTASAVGPNGHTGLTTCVSLNTAVAARVGNHRVSFQPNLSGEPDPSGLQVRVDGTVKTLGPQGLALGPSGRVVKSAIGGGIEIQFPDGTLLVVTPNFWGSQGKWYLNLNAYHTAAQDGAMGALAPGSWLPALPDGTSMGARPGALHDRYVALYEKFGAAWRVTPATSLFDYGPGTSTATFTVPTWPMENPPCVLPNVPPVQPLPAATAKELCRAVKDKARQSDCTVDVAVTGERGFAKAYLLTERIQRGLTTTAVTADKERSRSGETVVFTAVVERALGGKAAASGTVQFVVDGAKAGTPVQLEGGRARWRTSTLKRGKHEVAARYTPLQGSVFLSSSSSDRLHIVGEEPN